MFSLYVVVLFLHSYLRWLVLALALVLLFRAFSGWRSARAWSPVDERVHAGFVGTLDLQLLLGLLLYVGLSPITRAFLASPGASMKVSELRFFGVEHLLLMLIAIVIVHVARVRSKKRTDARLRQRGVFVSTLVALLLIFASIPWPFMHAPRPLFRASTAAAAPAEVAACPPSYAARCASCHGPEGRGDGPLAASLAPRPRSFTDDPVTAKSDAELRAIIIEGGAKHGLSALMPAHPDLAADDDELVKCVRSFR